jgi:hypothetical protein
MLITLALITLATLGSWDILRRLLPVRIPVVIGKLLTVAIAYSLLNWGTRSIVVSLCVPGVLLLLNGILRPEPSSPWGIHLARSPKRTEIRKPVSRTGNRIPPIGGR